MPASVIPSVGASVYQRTRSLVGMLCCLHTAELDLFNTVHRQNKKIKKITDNDDISLLCFCPSILWPELYDMNNTTEQS